MSVCVINNFKTANVLRISGIPLSVAAIVTS